jgi:hypothetical protein
LAELLRNRGSRVFVMVGPFNEHLLAPESRERFEKVKATIVAWLTEKHIPHLAPAPLPSDQYGDASHPLAAGYHQLARQLSDHQFFKPAPPTTTSPVTPEPSRDAHPNPIRS